MTTINQPPTTRTPSTRTTGESVRAIPAAIHSEWIKVTSLRSFAAIVGMAAAVSGFIAWAVARFVDDAALTTAEFFTGSATFTAVFAAIAGILMFSSEAQHGTLAGMLTAQPSKTVITAAKAVAASSYGAFLAAIGMVAAIAGSQLGGMAFGDTTNVLGDASQALVFTSIASVLGLGIGMITRHSAAAISGVLAWWLLGETLFMAFVDQQYARFMPFAAGNALVGVSTGPESVNGDLVLTATEGGLVFGTYALGALVLGAVLLKKAETN